MRPSTSVCIVIFYTNDALPILTMPTEKTVSVSFRVTPEFRELLERAAAKEQRNRTNFLEWLLFNHCRQNGLLPICSAKVTAQGAQDERRGPSQ